MRETCPTTSRATVYKTLDTLKAIGEVLELQFRDGSNRYDGVRPPQDLGRTGIMH